MLGSVLLFPLLISCGDDSPMGPAAITDCIDYGDVLRLVGSVDRPDCYVYGVAVSGTRAYVGVAGGLLVIDISTPASPVIAGSVDTPDNAAGGAVSGTHAYIADWGSGLQVIDISTPASPVVVGSFDTPHRARGVAVSGTHAYVADLRSGLLVASRQCP